MIQTELFGTITPKLWGHETLLTNTPDYCGKFLSLAGGYRCSLHRHHFKDETFFVLEGAVTIEWIDPVNGACETRVLYVGENFHVPRGMYHRFSSPSPALLLEISTRHSDSDVSRLVDSSPIPSTYVKALEEQTITPTPDTPITTVPHTVWDW